MQTIMRTSRPRPFCLAALALACTAAQADWVLPPGASANLGGGQASLGCTNLQHSGALTLDSGALVAARDVQVAAGAQFDIGSGRVELAQQWLNQGSATATSGGVTRVASPGCPVVGQAGPVPLQAPPTPLPVPLPPGGGGSGSGGGTASVAIGVAGAGGGAVALPPGCTITSLTIDDAATAPPGAPANARLPLGVLRFAAQGCTNAVLSVSVTYPAGSLAGLTVQKHGPHGSPRRTGWFTPQSLAVVGDTVRYTVADNGEGDNNPATGAISDPLAPMLLAAPPGPGPGGAHAIPTLGEWGLLLLSALMGLLGLRRLRTCSRSFRGSH